MKNLLFILLLFSCAVANVEHDASGRHYKSLKKFLKNVDSYQLFSGKDAVVAEISEGISDRLTIKKSKSIKGQYVHLYSFLPQSSGSRTLTVLSHHTKGNVLFIPQIVLIDGKKGRVTKVETKGRIKQGNLVSGPQYIVELNYKFKNKTPYFFIVTSNPKYARTKKLESDYISEFMDESVSGAGYGKYSLYID